MYIIEENKDITRYTTFGIPVHARYFAEYSNEKELLKLSRTEEFLNNEVFHIGGGSNLLFMEDFDGMILHSAVKGIKAYHKNEDTVYAIAGAGEKWTDFVEWCVREGLAGVENLAGIPGEVGASAVQNVGAYGMEAADTIYSVECFDSMTREIVTFKNEDCRFGYRDSIFKREGRNRYYVLRVSFRLRPSTEACCLTYGPLVSFRDRLAHTPTIREVADEIKRIRDEKLPDPHEIGSAGSFFKNPIVPKVIYKDMQTLLGFEVPAHEVDARSVKLSAAWLIDHSGLKGERIGGAQVYEKQPLVIVNRDHASAADVAALARRIQQTVRQKFFVYLRPEVNYIDTSLKVTVLGSGTSKGVPEMGCKCRVCQSSDSHDKRLRASALVETAGLKILIDASPDLRQQALANDIDDVDAILITHSHYDHVGGVDDLRPFCSAGPLPMFVRKDVDGDLRRRLDYCFRENLYPGVPTFDMRIIDNKDFYVQGLKITPIEVMHGKLPIFGYRIGKFAYVTDCKTISEEEKEKLAGLDILILNALRDKPHFAHLSLSEALELIEEVKPKETYLTHFNHEIGLHHEIEAKLPPHVHPAYDGLTLKIK